MQTVGYALEDMLGDIHKRIDKLYEAKNAKANGAAVVLRHKDLIEIWAPLADAVPLSYRDVPRKERQARVAEILDEFQIVGKKDLYPPQLSGGQQQQVAVARAVIAKPRVVLADEPTGSLHWGQGERIMELLRKLNNEGTTIVQVTHDERVASYGNRMVELQDGWIS
jgi:ABC-type lipoprotein export system ATPase subunit